MKVPINRDLITDQMNSLGLSERAVLSRTGMPNASFRTARKEGLLEGSLSLRQVHDLAELLGVRTVDLLTPTDTDEPIAQVMVAGATAEATPAEDAATLIPLLLQVPRLVAVDHLGRTLDWDRARLQAALDAIPTLLSGTGLRLHTSHGQVRVVPTNPTDKRAQQALGRIRSTSRDLTTSEAKVLRRVAAGENVLDRRPSNSTRVNTGSLKNMGCIELDHSGVYTTTDALRLALPDLGPTCQN